MKTFEECKQSVHENKNGHWVCLIECPDNPIHGIVAVADTEAAVIEKCTKLWNNHYGKLKS